MAGRKKSTLVAPPDDPILPETEDYEEKTDGNEWSELDPTEWTLHPTGEPAADVIANYVFIHPWKKPSNAAGDKRKSVMCVEIREREGGNPMGPLKLIWAHNVKTDGDDLAGSLDEFLGNMLQPMEDPIRYIWQVSRNPMPEQRAHDSNQMFHIVNRAWRENPGGVPVRPVPHTGGVPGGLVPSTGLMPSAWGGPSPLGVYPAQHTVAPMMQAAPQLPGVHGDIGGTGMRDLVYAFTEMFTRVTSIVEKNQLFYADLIARIYTSLGQKLSTSPNESVEVAKLHHQLELKRLELSSADDVSKRAETSGVIKDLGGQLIQNPGLTAILMAGAKKLGVDEDTVVKLMTGGDE